MKMKWKIIIFSLLLVMVLGYGFYEMNRPKEIDITEAYKGTGELYFIETGYVASQEDMTIYPLAAGKIENLYVEENQYVNKGDILLEIDTKPYEFELLKLKTDLTGIDAQIENLYTEENKSKTDLKARRDSLQGELSALSAKIDDNTISVEEQKRLQNILIEQNKSNYNQALKDYEDYKALYEAGAISKIDLDKAKDTVDALEKELEGSIQQIKIIESNLPQGSNKYLEGMQASLNAQIEGIDNTLKSSYTGPMASYYQSLKNKAEVAISEITDKIENCVITAPISGKITKLYVKNVNTVFEGPIATIENTDTKKIETYVSTKDIEGVKIGDKVELTSKRRDEDLVFSGTVEEIADNAEVKISPLGIEERKIKVRIKPDKADLNIGYDLDVRFVFYREENKIMVPKTAVFEEEGIDYLWAVENDKLVKKEIKKGLELRTDIVIEEGLLENEKVIKDPNEKGLKNGMKVIDKE